MSLKFHGKNESLNIWISKKRSALWCISLRVVPIVWDLKNGNKKDQKVPWRGKELCGCPTPKGSGTLTFAYEKFYTQKPLTLNYIFTVDFLQNIFPVCPTTG